MCVCPTGPSGVGLTELKRKLLLSDLEQFGVAVPREFKLCYSLHSTCIHMLFHSNAFSPENRNMEFAPVFLVSVFSIECLCHEAHMKADTLVFNL